MKGWRPRGRISRWRSAGSASKSDERYAVWKPSIEGAITGDPPPATADTEVSALTGVAAMIEDHAARKTLRRLTPR